MKFTDNTFPRPLILTRDECKELDIPYFWVGKIMNRIRLKTIRKNLK